MPKTLNEALSDYYEVRLTPLAQATREQHEMTLERWRTWITRETQPNVYLDDIDDRQMVRYFNRLLPPGHSERTFNNYRQIHRQFWQFCRGEAWIRVDPMRHVDPLKVPKKTRLMLSADELLRMLEISQPRDRVGLAIGMNTALRAGDISALTIGDVNLGDDTLAAYHSKTKESDGLPITAELRVELLRWMQHYADVQQIPFRLLPNTWRLVPPIQSMCVNPQDITLGRTFSYVPTRRLGHMERIVQQALAQMGHETRGEGFHTLRRSTLRVLFDMAASDGVGDPIRIPQSLAGHKNRQTTEIYLGITHEKRMRDEMLRGKSFLTRAVGVQEERHGGNKEGDGGSVAV